MTESNLRFDALPLAAPLQRALADKGYTTPSPVQEQAIPHVLEGRDVLACAQTGTGKTAAFALPILHELSLINARPARGEIRCLILTPTRELAVQIADSFDAYGKHLRFSGGLVYGGVSQGPQVKKLRNGLDVLVATPGRLIDLMEQGHVDLADVACFVLDEADRMLDMGFIPDIRRIAKELPTERQTLFFSATMEPEVTRLANTLLHDPVEIRIAPDNTTADNIDQRIHFVEQANKLYLLVDLMNRHQAEHGNGLGLVFSRTKHGAQKLAQKLNQAGIDADAIHGNKSQSQRQRTLDRFRAGRTRVLVATDVASRGIDVRNITLVVNYDLPMEPDAYVHRIGRTARAGESGRAVSFCARNDLGLLRSVEKRIKQKVTIDSDHIHHAEHIASRHAQGGHSNGSSGNRRSQGGPRGNRSGNFRPNRNRRPAPGRRPSRSAR